MIGDQILVDDEWHSLNYVIGKDFYYLLTHYALPGATCIPQNIYNLLLLRTTGWSEIMLRLPSLVAGIAALIVFPILARSLLERRPNLLFMILLSSSPFLVFYSRVARPYSMFVAFGFSSLIFGYKWLRSGRRGDGFAYLLTGILAIESHLFALPAVVAPLVAGSFFKLMERYRKSSLPLIAPSWTHLAACGVALSVLVALLQGPALFGAIHTTMTLVAGRDSMTPESAWSGLSLLSGTANPVLVSMFIALLLYGLWSLFRSNVLVACLFFIVFVDTLAALFILRPDSVDAAIVIARYCIIFFPISYLLVAKGVDDLIVWLKTSVFPSMTFWSPLPGILYACFVVLFLSSGPWIPVYALPNSFTNHSAYQQSYRSIAWDRFYFSDMVPRRLQPDKTVRREELSPFYLQLPMDMATVSIVEFPMMIGDHVNPYYYFQHFHRKRVMIGYDSNFPSAVDSMFGYVHASTYVDQVLSRVAGSRKIKLRNMIDISDVDALRQSGASYLVLHPHLEAELSLVAAPYPSMDRLVGLYEKSFGPSVYRDKNMEVFLIERSLGR